MGCSSTFSWYLICLLYLMIYHIIFTSSSLYSTSLLYTAKNGASLYSSFKYEHAPFYWHSSVTTVLLVSVLFVRFQDQGDVATLLTGERFNINKNSMLVKIVVLFMQAVILFNLYHPHASWKVKMPSKNQQQKKKKHGYKTKYKYHIMKNYRFLFNVIFLAHLGCTLSVVLGNKAGVEQQVCNRCHLIRVRDL